MNDRLPYAMRHLPLKYSVLHKLTLDDAYLHATQNEFVRKGIELSKGYISPDTIKQAYSDLMKDAGLTPILARKDKTNDH